MFAMVSVAPPIQDAPAGAESREQTREQILDVAEDLLRSRSFHAFSYADIAARIGIRKASIHYHFPSKEELGLALIDRFGARMNRQAEAIKATDPSPIEKLELYFRRTEDILREANRICIFGVLEAEFNALPTSMQERVAALQAGHYAWLVRLLEWGRSTGVFRTEGTASDQASMIAASVQGALQIARATGDDERYYGAVRQVRAAVIASTG